jgi:hypothetical protein
MAVALARAWADSSVDDTPGFRCINEQAEQDAARLSTLSHAWAHSK